MVGYAPAALTHPTGLRSNRATLPTTTTATGRQPHFAVAPLLDVACGHQLAAADQYRQARVDLIGDGAANWTPCSSRAVNVSPTILATFRESVLQKERSRLSRSEAGIMRLSPAIRATFDLICGTQNVQTFQRQIA
jgi:hypothetical protein